MDRKGYLRLVEASISIIIIITVLFLFFNQQRESNEPDLSERARDILEEISRNITLREAILSYVTDPPENIPLSLDDYISQRVFENYLSFEVVICEVGEACGKSEYTPGNVYSAERVISSTINTLSPKKIRLFIWEVG